MPNVDGGPGKVERLKAMFERLTTGERDPEISGKPSPGERVSQLVKSLSKGKARAEPTQRSPEAAVRETMEPRGTKRRRGDDSAEGPSRTGNGMQEFGHASKFEPAPGYAEKPGERQNWRDRPVAILDPDSEMRRQELRTQFADFRDRNPEASPAYLPGRVAGVKRGREDELSQEPTPERQEKVVVRSSEDARRLNLSLDQSNRVGGQAENLSFVDNQALAAREHVPHGAGHVPEQSSKGKRAIDAVGDDADAPAAKRPATLDTARPQDRMPKAR